MSTAQVNLTREGGGSLALVSHFILRRRAALQFLYAVSFAMSLRARLSDEDDFLASKA